MSARRFLAQFSTGLLSLPSAYCAMSTSPPLPPPPKTERSPSSSLPTSSSSGRHYKPSLGDERAQEGWRL